MNLTGGNSGSVSKEHRDKSKARGQGGVIKMPHYPE
jgi:hypothetical protein